jgi:beta-ureidopropionase / N-carbamoyl-L-amino-acid hydrolase
MITINAQRLLWRMDAMACVGALSGGGVKRLALSDEDKAGRELFIRWCRELGLEVSVDQMGSVFARKPGLQPDLPAILSGSHLDTQPSGGRFDGVLGVLAALEGVQTIIENDISHNAPIEIVSWTNEEGARFAPAMVASGVFAGAFSLDYGLSRCDNLGIGLGDELQRIGCAGERPAVHSPHYPFKAYLELHIEQGPILHRSGDMIGIVTGVQGIRWYDVVITGIETHAGPTPMEFRKDPVPVLGRIITGLYELVAGFGPDARLTIGKLSADPGSRNTVPGTVRFSIDIRHPDNAVLQTMYEAVMSFCSRYSAECTEVWHSPPVYFDETCIAAVEAATKRNGLSSRRMVSGAGHDAVYVSRVVPTAMIFVPSRDGISHNEAEFTAPEQVIAGANVLLSAILLLADTVPGLASPDVSTPGASSPGEFSPDVSSLDTYSTRVPSHGAFSAVGATSGAPSHGTTRNL